MTLIRFFLLSAALIPLLSTPVFSSSKERKGERSALKDDTSSTGIAVKHSSSAKTSSEHPAGESVAAITVSSPSAEEGTVETLPRDSSLIPNTLAKPKPKPISMGSYTFPDVASFDGGVARSVSISLPYTFRPIDPRTTRLFFQGEALLIDPKTSCFETYVTSPLRPCLLGRILDRETGKSLVFHKYAVHSMESLRPYFAKLAPSNPANLEVTLFTCEMSPAMVLTHAPYYGGKTQAHEMNAVRAFLAKEFLIPEDNIERRFLKDSTYKGFPPLGQYEFTPVTIGISKTGEVFNTSLFSVDFFGVGAMPTPPRIRKKNSKTIQDVPLTERCPMMQTVSNAIHAAVKTQYDTDLSHNTYWSRPFYTAERMDVPAVTLGDMFGIVFEDSQLLRKDIFASSASSSHDGKDSASAAASSDGKDASLKIEKKEKKKKKTRKKK